MSRRKYKKAVLIDAYYPFEKGESFIENEIEHLKSFCQELIVVPTYATDFSVSRLKATQNIHIIELTENKLKKMLWCLAALTNREVLEEIKMLKARRILSAKTLRALLVYWTEGTAKARQLRKQLASYISQDDTVLFYSYWLDTNAYIVGQLKKMYVNCVAVSRAHGFDIYEDRHYGRYFPLREATFSGIDLICPISENGREYLASRYPQLKEKMSTFYLGTLDHGQNLPESDGKLRIVSCSNLIPVKRVRHLIEALSKITDMKVSWTHYGDGALRNALQEQAQKELTEKIEWNFAGAVSNQKLMELYKARHYDVFVNVSESEGLPVSIMEAMSFGIPVIATDVGGTGEIVADGHNGYLLPKDLEPQDLAYKLLDFAAMAPEQRVQMRTNARKTWEEKFNAADNYRKFYERIAQVLE